MAQNAIDLVITQDAIKQVDNLISKLSLAESEMLKLAQASLTASKSVSGISTPSGLSASSGDNATINAQLKAQSDIISKLNKEIQGLNDKMIKLNETKRNTNKLTADEIVANQELRKEAIQTARENSALIGSYQKLNIEHQKAIKTAQDAAVTYGLTSKEFQNASEKANKLDQELKTIDATLGKNTRNVGNYNGKFNGLSNSINQLTREAPAFANSMQTGFMAISNNIPAFTDAIGQLKQNNKDLVAQGEKPVSIMKSLGESLFSFNTLISLGVTLLTVYGAKLIDYAFNTDAAKESTDRLTKSLKDNEEQVANNIKQIENQTEIDLQLARKRGASDEELAKIKIKSSVDIVTEYEKNYNKAVQKLDAFDSYRRLKEENSTKALLFLAQKNGGDIEKARTEYLRREKAYTEENRKLLVEDKNKYDKKLKEANDKMVLGDLTSQADLAEKKKAAQEKANADALKAEEERLKLLAELRKKELQAELAAIDVKLANEAQYLEERLALLDQDFLKRSQIAKVDYDEALRLAKGNQTKEKIALIEYQNEQIKIMQDFDKKKKELKKTGFTEVGDATASWDEEKKRIEQNAENLNKINEDAQKAHTAWKFKKYEEDWQKEQALLKEKAAYMRSFVDEFINNSGLTETFKLFEGEDSLFARMNKGMAFTKDSWKADTVQMMEGVQEMFNFISNASQANFEAEYARLESQKEISIQFAGDSASAKKKIEEDYDKKKREIANREAQAKKKQAMVNVAIDTAQAILGIWAQVPKVDFGISATALSIAVGALGAAQIGMIAAQKIPQYAQGTDNHKGGLMLVNDGKGSNYQETVILPSGQVIQPQGRNVLMDAPAGTKVLTHEQQLKEMLSLRGISMANTQKYEGMNASEMDAILSKHFSGIKTQSTIIDKNGFTQYVKNGNSRTIINAARFSGTGLSV